MAERCSLSPIAISKFERNISEPSFETTVKLATAFGMKASEFIIEIEMDMDGYVLLKDIDERGLLDSCFQKYENKDDEEL